MALNMGMLMLAHKDVACYLDIVAVRLVIKKSKGILKI